MKATRKKSEYDLQAEKFCQDTGLRIESEYIGHQLYFDDDKQRRAVYRVTLTRGGDSFSFNFGQSIVNSYCKVTPQRPGCMGIGATKKIVPLTEYDILACMEKYDPGTFQDFCDNSGYDNDSIKAREIYFKCQDQYSQICRMFTSAEIERLQDIN